MPTQLEAATTAVHTAAVTAIDVFKNNRGQFGPACWDVGIALSQMLAYFRASAWDEGLSPTIRFMRETLIASGSRNAREYYARQENFELEREIEWRRGCLMTVCNDSSLADGALAICTALAASLGVPSVPTSQKPRTLVLVEGGQSEVAKRARPLLNTR